MEMIRAFQSVYYYINLTRFSKYGIESIETNAMFYKKRITISDSEVYASSFRTAKSSFAVISCDHRFFAYWDTRHNYNSSYI